MRTNFSKELEGSCNLRTDCAQFLTETEHRKMRFPKIIKHCRFEATIYGKSKKYHYYRITYYAVGKRQIRSFKTFSEAKTEAERIVRDLADGSQSAALSANQSRDAITAFEMLEAFRQTGGRRISLPAAISEFVEASKKLGERTLNEATDGFLKTVATVTRKDIGEAVEEFLQAAEMRTKAAEGQRSQLSASVKAATRVTALSRPMPRMHCKSSTDALAIAPSEPNFWTNCLPMSRAFVPRKPVLTRMAISSAALSACAPRSMSRSRGRSPMGWSLSRLLETGLCAVFPYVVLNILSFLG
jgi:hypothetical protein